MPCSNGPANRSRGFTLIELMITLAVAAILMMIAAPSFKGLLSRSNLSAANNELLGAMNYARNEAISRSRDITLSATTSEWKGGWEVEIPPASASDPPVTLRQYAALAPRFKVEEKNNTTEITFNGRGVPDREICFSISDTDTSANSSPLHIKMLVSGSIHSVPDCL